jgi:hypothetical protein
VGIDELRAVVRIDAEDRERELADDVLDCFEHPDRSLVLDRAIDRPSGGDVSNCKGEVELAAGVAPFVVHQVDLDEPRRLLIPEVVPVSVEV